jgi:hypothetical protein
MHPDQLNELTTLANRLGAEGVWLIRGATGARIKFDWPAELTPAPKYEPVDGAEISTTLGFNLALADAELLVLLRFPIGDGGAPGIESR